MDRQELDNIPSRVLCRPPNYPVENNTSGSYEFPINRFPSNGTVLSVGPQCFEHYCRWKKSRQQLRAKLRVSVGKAYRYCTRAPYSSTVW